MFCCPNCFNHVFLQDYIETNSRKVGECILCQSQLEQPLLDATSLVDLFQPLIDLYQKSPTGRSLFDRLQEDWQIFNDSLTKRKQIDLLASIVSDKMYPNMKVDTQPSYGASYINRWEEFKQELQHQNRFFPKKAIATEELKELFDFLILDKDKKPKHIFRARINRLHKQYDISEMGKPPDNKAPDGRANPKGISYFYGASDAITAIAETRPYKSEILSVARFALDRKAILIDLRNPKKTISPFGMDDDNLSLLFFEHMPFLSLLGLSLSIPILPDKKDFEYLPTQYLSELIKDKGFDGILFKSSLGEGDNVVIFDDSLLVGTNVEAFRNDNVYIKPVKIKL